MAQKTKKRRPSDCKVKTNGEQCRGKYKLNYEDNAPIFTCNKCEDKELTWKKFYNEYLQLFKDKDNWDSDKDKISCIIGFFCYMYEEFYQTSYIFVPQNPNPYGSKECKDAWKLLATFENDAHAVRRYIHWVFKKLIRGSTNITAFGYINSPGIIRKYNLYVQKKQSFSRASTLPSEFIKWCKTNVPEIFDEYELTTMNDLGALLSFVKFYNTNDNSKEKKIILMAEKLKLIQDDKLNIRELK